MKKTLVGLSIISATILNANVNISAAFTKNNVWNSPIKSYKTLDMRIEKVFNDDAFIGVEYETSDKFQNHRLNRYQLIQGYQLQNNSNIIPYVYLGVGYQTLRYYDDSWICTLGLGSKYKLSNKLNLFAEIRGIRDFHNNDNHLGCVIGLNFSFGTKNNNNTNIKTPSDSDKDGVPDNIDLCPNTPQGIKVNTKGCPIDSDHDGIADYMDKCPNTPIGIKVDKHGCPLDSDKDGIPDYLDKCPNTPSGIKVDKNGCPVSFTFDVTFKFNSYEIEPQYMPEIKKFASFLKANPAYKADIEGYTDNTGSPVYNKLLSLKRAKSIYEALIKEGIDKNRLTFAGFGDENPIAPNITPEGRAKNRRVIAKLYY